MYNTYAKQYDYNLECFLCPLLALEVLQDIKCNESPISHVW